ncbi:MAG TPA: HD-GYP domain-containing protein [Rhodocyclaceae bacterium]
MDARYVQAKEMAPQVALMLLVLNERDAYTCYHSAGVVRWSERLGCALGLDEPQLKTLRTAAALHDVGKIGTPDSVLRKAGRLSEEEMSRMRSHCESGRRIVAACGIEDAEEVAEVVLHHHEAYDGSGYPDGLAGEEIPFYSRILAIADSYDAMATRRSYRGALPHRKIMYELNAYSSRYDPDILRTFAHLLWKQTGG